MEHGRYVMLSHNALQARIFPDVANLWNDVNPREPTSQFEFDLEQVIFRSLKNDKLLRPEGSHLPA
jgi:hypothetical protein